MPLGQCQCDLGKCYRPMQCVKLCHGFNFSGTMMSSTCLQFWLSVHVLCHSVTSFAKSIHMECHCTACDQSFGLISSFGAFAGWLKARTWRQSAGGSMPKPRLCSQVLSSTASRSGPGTSLCMSLSCWQRCIQRPSCCLLTELPLIELLSLLVCPLQTKYFTSKRCSE